MQAGDGQAKARTSPWVKVGIGSLTLAGVLAILLPVLAFVLLFRSCAPNPPFEPYGQAKVAAFIAQSCPSEPWEIVSVEDGQTEDGYPSVTYHCRTTSARALEFTAESYVYREMAGDIPSGWGRNISVDYAYVVSEQYYETVDSLFAAQGFSTNRWDSSTGYDSIADIEMQGAGDANGIALAFVQANERYRTEESAYNSSEWMKDHPAMSVILSCSGESANRARNDFSRGRVRFTQSIGANLRVDGSDYDESSLVAEIERNYKQAKAELTRG